ncbi:uncharacterized protein LOC105841979 [Bombyx mori]|uniref:U1-type domain-containing protein n=1 Tax=Bombyx mori TaxID=7091 RepID=A0A8R2C6T6_BOMMO|nr:uncharacterized protein LOC105841979 [Bombyx mori]XP_012547635.1 uncharacterized protein LOC105841979 [Bombyx mori]XP_012547640.1 uncharacterized protein LOC105841979 [Bombyx mori]XP_021205300.1 uncharacterized protein LOC105841979 [Bombyx mori]
MAAEATENRPVRTDSASDGDDTSDANNQKTEDNLFTKFAPTLISRGVLLTCEMYLTRHQWNTLAVVGRQLSCAVCDQLCEANAFSEHISSEHHVRNMEKFEPLEEFGPTITRKIRQRYHCGICNVFLLDGDENQHFRTESHIAYQTKSNLRYYDLTQRQDDLTYRIRDTPDNTETENEGNNTLEPNVGPIEGNDQLKDLKTINDARVELLKTVTSLGGFGDVDTDKTHGEIVVRPFDVGLVITRMAYNTIVVKEKAVCRFCDLEFDGKDAMGHVNEAAEHNATLTVNFFLGEYRNNLIRLIRGDFHCAICNVFMKSNDLSDHVESLSHMLLLTKSMEKCNPGISNCFRRPQNMNHVNFSHYYVNQPTRSLRPYVAPIFPLPMNFVPNIPLGMYPRPAPFAIPNFPVPYVMPNYARAPGIMPNFMPFRLPFPMAYSRPRLCMPPQGFWPVNFHNPPAPYFPVNRAKDTNGHARSKEGEADTGDSHSEDEDDCYDKDQRIWYQDIYYRLLLKLNHEQFKRLFELESESGMMRKTSDEKDKEDDSIYVYVQLKKCFYKIKSSCYHTLVEIGRSAKYCFVCSAEVKNSDVKEHVDSIRHNKNLKECNFSIDFWKHLVRQVEDNFHCGLCNLFIPSDMLLAHLQWPTHVSNFHWAFRAKVPSAEQGTPDHQVERPEIGPLPKREDLKLDFLFADFADRDEFLASNKLAEADRNRSFVESQDWQGTVGAGGHVKCPVCDDESSSESEDSGNAESGADLDEPRHVYVEGGRNARESIV